MRKSHKWNLLQVFILCVISIFAIWADPLGYSDATSKVSRDFFYKVISVNYPHNEKDPVTTIILDDEDIEPYGTWPVSYGLHAGVLNAINSFRPKAVFIDIAFIDNRVDPSIKNFLHALNSLHRSGTKIYLATTHRLPKIRDDIRELVDKEILKLVSIDVNVSKSDYIVYPLVDDKQELPSAALAIFEDFRPNEGFDKIKSGKMDVFWAAPPHSFNCRSPEQKEECQAYSENILLRFLRLTANGILGNIFSFNEIDQFSVPYIPQISASDLLDGAKRELLAPHLSEAYVLYGVNFVLTHDQVHNPVYGNLPGVHLHAMALDNLIAYGDDYILDDPLKDFSNEFHQIIIVILSGIVLFLWRVLSSLVNTHCGIIKIPAVLDVVILFLFLVFVAYVQFEYGRFSPTNWVGIFSVFLIGQAGVATYLSNFIVSRFSQSFVKNKRE